MESNQGNRAKGIEARKWNQGNRTRGLEAWEPNQGNQAKGLEEWKSTRPRPPRGRRSGAGDRLDATIEALSATFPVAEVVERVRDTRVVVLRRK